MLTTQLQQLTARRLLVEQASERYLFAHALIHEATYQTVLRRERRLLHKLVGEILEAYLESNSVAIGDVAYHFYEAGEWAQALTYTRRAGEKAQAMSAPHEALSHYTYALDAARQLNQPAPWEVLRARGQVHEILGNFEAARADHETVLQIGRQLGETAIEWQALVDLGVLWASRDYGQTGRYFQQALAVARLLPDPLALAHTLNRFGNWLVNIERPHEALNLHREALQIFEQHQHLQGLAETLDLLGMTNILSGAFTEGSLCFRRAASIFESLAAYNYLPSVLASLAETGVAYTSRLSTPPMSADETRQLARRALQLAHDLQWRAAEAYAQVILGHIFFEQGCQAEALAHTRQGCAIAREIDHRQWLSFGVLVEGVLYANWFDWETAYKAYAESLTLAQQVGSGFWETTSRAHLAEACVGLGRLTEATTLLWPVDSDFHQLGVPHELLWSQWWLWCARIRWALACQESNLACRWSEQLLAQTVGYQLGHEAAFPWLAWLRGCALLACQQWVEAERVLRAACMGALAQERRVILWQTHAALAQALHAQGRLVEAQAELTYARHWAQQVGNTIPDPSAQARFWRGVEARLNSVSA
jgi:tetratricopeptide (TPR) repeat protein